MSRIYTAQFNGVAATAQQDLFEIVAPPTAIVVIHELCLSQLTEVADAAEEMLLILLKSGSTTIGSGGSFPPIVKRAVGDGESGAIVKANNTTKATGGTIVTHHAWNWNVRVPFQMIWTPETRPVLAPNRRGTVELATTPADSITMAGYLVWEEIG